jgi:hypothetical protein
MLTPLPPRDVSESVLFETLRQACLNSCLITPFSKGLSLFETPRNIDRADSDHLKGVAILSVFHSKSQDCHSGIYLFGGLCKEPHIAQITQALKVLNPMAAKEFVRLYLGVIIDE